LLQANDISETWILSNLRLKKGKDVPLRRFHPFVFSGAIQTALPTSPGFALLESFEGEPLAIIMLNPEVGLCGRVFISSVETLKQWNEGNATSRIEIIDSGVQQKLDSALKLRESLFAPYFYSSISGKPLNVTIKAESTEAVAISTGTQVISGMTSTFRWVNAEGDQFPGLILDHYNGTVVMQVSTAVCDLLRPAIVRHIEGLSSRFPGPLKILERSDGGFRRAENLGPVKAWHNEPGEQQVWFKEDGLDCIVDVENGQKTGFFIDMRCMRELLGSLCEDRDVLNLFSYTGGFGLHALRGAAKSLVQVDRSSSALEFSQQQIEKNFGKEIQNRCQHHCMDVDQYLKDLPSETRFDVVIADPPAFAKKRADVKNAVRAYRKLHRSSIQRVRSGGLFLACSCSHFISAEHFHSILVEALAAEGRQAQIISQHRQAPCHPLAANHPEGHYLKSLLLRVY
tara:strand:- start:136393 stop:137760 length:1368 start_codon:yes stop_codon:yes gene_type:complete